MPTARTHAVLRLTSLAARACRRCGRVDFDRDSARHVCVDADRCGVSLRGHQVGDDRAPVAALRDEFVYPRRFIRTITPARCAAHPIRWPWACRKIRNPATSEIT